MKIREIVTEGKTETLQQGVARAMPATYVLPDLRNQDPYLQYRFGMALAAAGAVKAGDVSYSDESAFGENMVVVARSAEESEMIQLALKLVGPGLNAQKMISTTASEEPSDTNIKSVVRTTNLGIKRKND